MIYRFLIVLTAGLLPWLAFGMAFRLTGDEVPVTYIEDRLKHTAEILYGPDIQTAVDPQQSLAPYQIKNYTGTVNQFGVGKTTVPLTVSDELLSRPEDAFLLFSDHPEILKENGLLFSAGIIFLRPVRLNFYHENGAGEPRRAVVIRLDNPSDKDAVVHVTDAIPNPGKYEVSLGHQATLMFLTRSLKNLGYISTVPAKGHLILSRQIAGPGDLVTGFLEITELAGHPLELTIMAKDPFSPETNLYLLQSSDTHVRGAYDIPHLYLRAHYVAGNQPTLIPLGDLPLKNILPGGELKGAYGMLWEGELLLENPSTSIETVPLYFQPRGGSASATFIIDDFIKEVAPTQAYQKVLLADFTLPPNSKRIVHFLTMPEGGSSYPIRLILGQSPDLVTSR